MTNKVDYQPVVGDSAKSCINCKHFEPLDGETGKCFGHKVSSKGTCNYFEEKEAVKKA